MYLFSKLLTLSLDYNFRHTRAQSHSMRLHIRGPGLILPLSFERRRVNPEYRYVNSVGPNVSGQPPIAFKHDVKSGICT